MHDICGLVNRVKVAAYLFYATSGWSDDVVVLLEVLHKEKFGRGGIGLISAIGHGLAAAGLIEWVTHIKPESLQELQSGHPNLRKHHVDVARYEETNARVLRYRPLICGFGPCCHF
jgi:hypothetical protein